MNFNKNFIEELEDAAIEWSKIFVKDECKDACHYGFLTGAKWQKEQMMKEAADATVHLAPGANPVIEIGVGRFGLKVRDKVKVIIVKEDEK